MEGVRGNDMRFLEVVDEGIRISEVSATASIVSALPKGKEERSDEERVHEFFVVEWSSRR
jgi:hypothetical protein